MQGTIAETHAVGVATTQKLVSQRGQMQDSINTVRVMPFLLPTALLLLLSLAPLYLHFLHVVLTFALACAD
jgi:hypothetical protein